MIRHAFVTVTDYDFFPGTLAMVNSVLEFQPEAEIFVINNEKRSLTDAQASCLQYSSKVSLLDSSRFASYDRYINAWELKAYGVHDLADGYDVIIGIDSDCLLCSNVDAEIRQCFESGCFLGGQDGEGVDYDASYRAYGISTPARNARYMSTSLFFCPVTEQNLRILHLWAAHCNAAVFNGRGPYPGHGDQGVLNAVIFAEGCTQKVTLLENRLWSQHWAYWDSITDFCDGLFLNRSARNQAQRAFHCGGAEKYWTKEHSQRVCNSNALQTYPYVWFLAMHWFGACRAWSIDPFLYLPPCSHHLTADLVHFLPQILQIYPDARSSWNGLTDAMIDRLLNGIARALSLGGGSMTDVINLVASHPATRRYVEVGSYEGGSILALALRFANQDIDFYSVESFMGDMDGSVDGHRLPSRRTYLHNLSRYPTLRVKTVPGNSVLAASLFADGSVDCVFIDGCHNTAAVVMDIDAWWPKISAGGIISGDDYDWETVRRAVEQRFSDVNVTPSKHVWWKERSEKFSTRDCHSGADLGSQE